MKAKKILAFLLGAFVGCFIVACSESERKIPTKEKVSEDDNVTVLEPENEIPEQEEIIQNDISAAIEAEEEGEYQIAAEMLIDNLKGDIYSESDYQAVIDFNQRLLDKLSGEITRKEISIFVPPDIDGKFTIGDGIAIGSSILNPFGQLIILGRAWYKYKKISDAQRDAVRGMQNVFPDSDVVKNNMENYEIVKRTNQSLEQLLKNRAKEKENRAKFKSILKQIKIVKAQKEIIKDNRTKYLSYTVVSPYLCESQRWLFLANSNYLALKGKDKDSLDNAVDFLAYACHKQWLYEIEEDVRKQFLKTQEKLKDIASKVELEEYKVVTTFSDSLDPSQKRGADAWWGE